MRQKDKKMKIAVTGGAGFIASHVADAYIKEGHRVHIIDNLSTGNAENINPNAVFHNIDICDKSLHKLFEVEKFDLVSHYAAQMNVRVSVSDPIFDATTNILGTLNILEAAKDTGVKKIVFASSGGTVYGEQDYFPADEEHPTRPCSPYGISKVAVEKYLFYYDRVYGLKNCIFRYGNVYGRRQNPHGEAGVVAIFIDKMMNHEQPVINGDGLITRDYIYIDDVVAANILALNPEVTGTYNVTTGVETDVNTIFRNLKELMHSECQEYHGEAKAGEQRRSVCSYKKIHDAFGFTPKFSFFEGMKQTVADALNCKK